ncbi:MAG: ABC transporter permease [Lachnospiraceae bacterium]|jgi:peptide/nickel transport system permease protein|nr:ABC transporter permease [Lachnospiraceae bacterium]
MKRKNAGKKRIAVFLGKNVIRALFLAAGVSIVTFFLVSRSPIDPLQANVGQAALGAMSEAQLQQLRDYWGMDTPAVTRFLHWAGDFLRGDMGVSLLYRRAVAEIIGEKLINSLLLMITAWILSGLLGFALGVIAGANIGKWQDRLIKGYAVLTASTPAYWIGLLLLLIFGVWLRLFPVGLGVPIGVAAEEVTILERLHHAVLPALALSITGASSIILHTREKMSEVMESDFMLYARARGERNVQMVMRHGIRNILLPAMTLQFASIGEIFGGSVLIEEVFSYPGLGQAAVSAGLGSDIPLLMAITVISALLIFAGNLTANVLYGVIDPRIQRGGQGS